LGGEGGGYFPIALNWKAPPVRGSFIAFAVHGKGTKIVILLISNLMVKLVYKGV